MTEQENTGNPQCQDVSHFKHLCYLISQGFSISDKASYETLISDPKFRCRHCGRAANTQENLCVPEKL